jgi:hypothetical protein
MMASLWVSLPAIVTKLRGGLYFHKMGNQIIYAGTIEQRMEKISIVWGKQNLLLHRKYNPIINE